MLVGKHDFIVSVGLADNAGLPEEAKGAAIGVYCFTVRGLYLVGIRLAFYQSTY